MLITNQNFPQVVNSTTAQNLISTSLNQADLSTADSSKVTAVRVEQLSNSGAMGLPLSPEQGGYSQEQQETARRALDFMLTPGHRSDRQKPEKNLYQKVVLGTGRFVGKNTRRLGRGAGWLGGTVVKNNPLAVASRNSAMLADMAGAPKNVVAALATANRSSNQAARIVDSGIQGVADFGAGTAEGLTEIAADPVGTAKALGTAATSGLDLVPVVGRLTSGTEAVLRGTDMATVRAEKKSNREAIVDGFVQDYTEKKGRIGTPGALISTALDVGIPTKLGVSVAKKAARSQAKRLDKNDVFRSLPDEQQTIIRDVADNNVPKVAGMKVPFWVGRTEQALSDLTRDGKLGQGSKLLSEIQELDRTQVHPSLSKSKVVRETIETVADPGKISQGCKGTCAITSPQYSLADEIPETFVQVTRELVSEKGVAKLSDGQRMLRNESGLKPDGSGRRTVDRVFQSSAMDFPNKALGKKQSYHNGKDAHLDDLGKKVHSGTTDDGRRVLNEALFGRNLGTQDFPNQLRGQARVAAENEFLSVLESARQQGRSLQVSSPWGDGPLGHAFTIERADGDFLIGRNPHGASDRGLGGIPRTMIDSQGRFRVKKSDFFDQLNSYERPAFE